MKHKELIGLPIEKVKECLKGEKYEIIDFSHPDRFHAETAASLRVVKIECGTVLKIYVAGFADKIEER